VVNDEAYVRLITQHALALPSAEEGQAEERLRIEQLTLLAGVRYRMASVLLHLGRPFAPPEVAYPMMDLSTSGAAGH
jgi:hypothetical protein